MGEGHSDVALRFGAESHGFHRERSGVEAWRLGQAIRRLSLNFGRPKFLRTRRGTKKPGPMRCMEKAERCVPGATG